MPPMRRSAVGRPERPSAWLVRVLAVAVVCAVATGGSPAFAQQQPSDVEQLAIYDLNVARADPPAYARSVGLGRLLDDVAPRPPLALNPYLVQSARAHAAQLAELDYFDHQNPVTGDWPNRMVRDAGYPLVSTWPDDANYVESLAAGFRSFQSALRALIEDVGFDPPGHRIHLLGLENFWLAQREIGVGYAFRSASTYGHYFAYHTGQRNHNRPFLTGVVYDDRNGNDRYDHGEGLGGVRIRVRGVTRTDTVTMDAGGWSVRVDRGGTHFVEASGGPFEGVVEATVTVREANVAVDFVSGQTMAQIGFEGVPTGAGTAIRLPGRHDHGCATHGPLRGVGLAWLMVLLCFVVGLALLRHRVGPSASTVRRDASMSSPQPERSRDAVYSPMST